MGVGHTLNPSTCEAEADGSLKLNVSNEGNCESDNPRLTPKVYSKIILYCKGKTHGTGTRAQPQGVERGNKRES